MQKKGDLDFDAFTKVFHKTGEEVEGEGNCLGWAARDTSGQLSPFKFQRRDLKPDDICIQITHAGICHSDLHQIRNEWSNATYPMVPGHEIVGFVTEVGSAVTKFKVGDRAGVGCMVDACFDCDHCGKGLQQFCRKGSVMTYNGKDYDGNITYGGYSTHIVVKDKAALKVPNSLPLDGVAPLLCAGITTYSPIKHYGLDKPGTKLGVLGLGGLGHMAVKFGVAMGCEVTVISRSKDKEAEAKALGAHHYLVSTDEEAMKAAAGTLDGIVDTVSAPHNTQQLVDLLDVSGTIVLVGAPPGNNMPVAQQSLIFKRAKIGGSLIGGFEETQEMLDFCGEKGVTSQVEVIDMQDVNKAMDRLAKGDVKFRFVIDVQKSLII